MLWNDLNYFRISRKEKERDRLKLWNKLVGKLITAKASVVLSLVMAESTLTFRLQQPKCALMRQAWYYIFAKGKNDFCNHLHSLDEMFFGLAAKGFRREAYESAKKNNSPHKFNKKLKLQEKNGYVLFWIPDVYLRQPTSKTIERAIGFNRLQVEGFYINLSALMDKYDFSHTQFTIWITHCTVRSII